MMVFLKEFFEKVDFEKNQQTTKKHEKLPSMQRVKIAKLDPFSGMAGHIFQFTWPTLNG